MLYHLWRPSRIKSSSTIRTLNLLSSRLGNRNFETPIRFIHTLAHFHIISSAPPSCVFIRRRMYLARLFKCVGVEPASPYSRHTTQLVRRCRSVGRFGRLPRRHGSFQFKSPSRSSFFPKPSNGQHTPAGLHLLGGAVWSLWTGTGRL